MKVTDSRSGLVTYYREKEKEYMRVPVITKTYNKQCGQVRDVCCPSCGQRVAFTKIKNKTIVSIMFIPFICGTNAAFLQCPMCGSAWKVAKKALTNIHNEQDVLNELHRIAEQKKTAVNKYSTGFSDKNQTIAVVLACLFTAYGAPFFYIGKPIYGMVCLLLSVISIIFTLFPLLFLMVYGGFVLAVLIGLGKVKDKNGKYIVSKKQRQRFLND